MDDSKIIELFYARSEQAIVELSKKYGRVCRQIAYNIVRNESDVEECLNDAYLKVWNTIPPNNPDKLVSYVCMTVRNFALDRIRADNAAKRVEFADADIDEVLRVAEYSDDMDDLISEKEFDNILNEFLSSLDRQGRALFIRRYFCHDKISDIARSFGQTPYSVSMRLSRIREKLKKFLLKKGIKL